MVRWTFPFYLHSTGQYILLPRFTFHSVLGNPLELRIFNIVTPYSCTYYLTSQTENQVWFLLLFFFFYRKHTFHHDVAKLIRIKTLVAVPYCTIVVVASFYRCTVLLCRYFNHDGQLSGWLLVCGTKTRYNDKKSLAVKPEIARYTA